MKRLTDEELTQIKERAEKATKGPWDVDVPVDYCTNCKNEYEIVQSELFLAPIVAELRNIEDAKFIAHAREDIPKLLAEVERLKIIIARNVSCVVCVNQLGEGWEYDDNYGELICEECFVNRYGGDSE